MEWFHGNVSSAESPLQKTPEVLDAIGMDLSANIGLHVIDNLMHKSRPESVISGSVISVEFGFLVNVRHDLSLQGLALHVRNNLGADFACVTIKESHDNSFTKRSATLEVTRFLFGMHVLNATADKSFVRFHRATIAAELRHQIRLQPKPNA